MSDAAGRLVGITGHQTLTPSTRRLVSAAIRSALQSESGPVGITSLAAGADQIFAQIVLELGGTILVVLPARHYEESFKRKNDLANFRRMLSEAEDVIALPFEEPSEEAYWAAGKEIVGRADRLLAIWDGQPAGGLGGTADVVRFAQAQGKPVTVIWPKGSARS